jgi:hypothetical protein
MKKIILAFAFIGFLATSSFAISTDITSSFDVEFCEDDKKCDKKSCTKKGDKKACKKGTKKACCSKAKAKSSSKEKAQLKKEAKAKK